MPDDTLIVPLETIESRILFVRGQRVILSIDLAALYGVEHRTLNQAVKRNQERFPEDFMFQMSPEEFANLKSQVVISSWGGARTPPYAFTEQGIAMLSSVLKSHRAVQVHIEIMRTFVRIRRMLISHTELSQRLEELERRHDKQFKIVFDAIRKMMAPPDLPKKRQIGFHASPEEEQKDSNEYGTAEASILSALK